MGPFLFVVGEGRGGTLAKNCRSSADSALNAPSPGPRVVFFVSFVVDDPQTQTAVQGVLGFPRDGSKERERDLRGDGTAREFYLIAL